MNRDHFWLSAEQFARLEPLLPTDTRGKPRVDDRRVISGIVHVLKSGGRWVDAPEVYGPRKTLYNRFVRWAARGVWADIFHALACAGGPPAQVLIDSSAVKAHRCASGGKGGSAIRPSAAREAGAPPRSTLWPMTSAARSRSS
jgi:transposase